MPGPRRRLPEGPPGRPRLRPRAAAGPGDRAARTERRREDDGHGDHGRPAAVPGWRGARRRRGAAEGQCPGGSPQGRRPGAGRPGAVHRPHHPNNLALCRRRGGTTVDQVLDFFPSLRKRFKVEAGKLSGGEQQMLAVGRALMLDPRVLLIDELSMGLAPVIVEELLPIVRRVATETNAAVVLVEQHVRLALEIADHAVVLAHGATVLARPAAELVADPSALGRAYMGETEAVAS